MPYGNATYLNPLSEEIKRYPTVNDNLNRPDQEFLKNQSEISKLGANKSFLDFFVYSLWNVICLMYSISLKIQVHIQKKFVEIVTIQYMVYLLYTSSIKENSTSSREKINQTKKEKSSKKKINQILSSESWIVHMKR